MRTFIIILTTTILAACSADRRGSRLDQGHTEACWIYAMTACVEHEMWLAGDSIPLSRQWILAKAAEEQTLERRLSRGYRKISLRGVGPEALRLMQRYGMVPFYQERSRINNSRTLARRLTLLADRSLQTGCPVPTLLDSARELLPRFSVAGRDKETFYLLGMQYTPRQFAESILYAQHWQFYASSIYHRYGEPFALEEPDNRRYHEYVNIPMRDMARRVIESLRQGHAVYWEYGFKPTKQPGGGGASSDHAVAIIGLDERPGQALRLVCLNSWGDDKRKFLVTMDYFMRHTCNVGLRTTSDR